MKHRLIVCRSCGQKNRIPLETWRADCGHCSERLRIPGGTEKMLRAKAPTIISVIGGIAMIGLLVSGVLDMAASGEQAAADESAVQTLADTPIRE